MLYAAPHFIPEILFLFLRVGLCSLEFVSCKTRGEAWRIESIATIATCQSRGLRVHRIFMNARALYRDLSDDFNNSPSDTWTHHDRPMKIQQTIETTLLFNTCDVDAS